jgi:hypothetical protein
MIVLVMLTLIFAILFMTATSSITASREGDPGDPSRKEAIDKVAKDTSDLRSQAEAYKEAIALRHREINRLDIELGKFHTYYVDGQPIAGSQGEDLTWNGKSYKAAEGPWLMTRALTSEVSGRMAAVEKEFKEDRKDIFASIDNEIDARSQEQQKVLQRVSEMDAAYKADEEKLIATKDELEKKKVDSDRLRRVDYGTRASAINKKEDAIRALLELELRWATELEADGSILDVSAETREVVLDLGSRDHAFPGLLFDIFAYEHGRYVVKGRLEVIDVKDRISTARITSEIDAKTRPIARGDSIANPVFDKRRPPVFTLAGEFQRFNKADLAAFIKATGAEVVDKLGPNVNFLVVDRPAKEPNCRSGKEQDLAREYQVQALTEDQLLTYVQTSFPVK